MSAETPAHHHGQGGEQERRPDDGADRDRACLLALGDDGDDRDQRLRHRCGHGRQHAAHCSVAEAEAQAGPLDGVGEHRRAGDHHGEADHEQRTGHTAQTSGTSRPVPADGIGRGRPGRRETGTVRYQDRGLIPERAGFSRPLNLILDPMAELIVDDADLVVHLTLGEKIWGFHGDIRVPLSFIFAVAPDPKPWMALRGWRMAGVSFPGTPRWAPAGTVMATISASCTATGRRSGWT